MTNNWFQIWSYDTICLCRVISRSTKLDRFKKQIYLDGAIQFQHECFFIRNRRDYISFVELFAKSRPIRLASVRQGERLVVWKSRLKAVHVEWFDDDDSEIIGSLNVPIIINNEEEVILILDINARIRKTYGIEGMYGTDVKNRCTLFIHLESFLNFVHVTSQKGS